MFLWQVRFALTSSPIFSRADTATDSERFYNSVLDLFDDVEEKVEVNDLIAWWNRYNISFCSNRLTDKLVFYLARCFPIIHQHNVQFAKTVPWLGSRQDDPKQVQLPLSMLILEVDICVYLC